MSEPPTEACLIDAIESSTNWQLCIVCQGDAAKKGPLVSQPQPQSYERILVAIQERAQLQDGDFVQIDHRLKGNTSSSLQRQGAIWHRMCYADTTHTQKIEALRERHAYRVSTGVFNVKQKGLKRNRSDMNDVPSSATTYTRSQTVPLNKNKCFFCQKSEEDKLFKVGTINAGQKLRRAVEVSGNPEMCTRLSTAISAGDAHAIDVRYHKNCWNVNVYHVLSHANSGSTRQQHNNSWQNAYLIELINLIDVRTKAKEIISIEDIETTYLNSLGDVKEIDKHTPSYNRKWLKSTIMHALPHLKSVLRKDRRKSAVLYSPDACDQDLVNIALATESESQNHMNDIYCAAKCVRKAISGFTNSVVDESIPVTSTPEDVPAELYSLIRWIMVGTLNELETVTRTRVVERTVITVCQNIMYGFKTDRQVQYKPTKEETTFKKSPCRENSQVLGLGLAIRHKTRSKKVIDLLNANNLCIPHSRVLCLETSLANAVVENMKRFDGLYVPPFIKKGTFVYFAVDNADFLEDTPDGKGTTHGTITVMYQKDNVQGDAVAPPLCITDTSSNRVTPYHTAIVPCSKPKPPPSSSEEESNTFKVSERGIDEKYKYGQMAWIMAYVASRLHKTDEDAQGNAEVKQSMIPGWAGYYSLVSEARPVTRIGALPLLPEVAHEWSTLMTVLSQTCSLNRLVSGQNHPTVISCDMALYEKVVKIIDSRPDLKKQVVPRLGELHVVMAALRALGTSIENSGIDEAWLEADVYGPATMRQILNCTNYKRSLSAHVYTYAALYEMSLQEFFKENPQIDRVCAGSAKAIEVACTVTDKSERAQKVKEADITMKDVLRNHQIREQFEAWEEKKSENAMFKAMMNYLHRVEVILHFIEASRNADLQLHLEAGEKLNSMFFAMDRMKYKRLWPRYLSDMQKLKTEHPNTWNELEAGNISVTKKDDIPFVSIGADHALEQVNKQIKDPSALIGISNNANARQRFFLAAPELSCLSSEYTNQFLRKSGAVREHHALQPSKVQREHIVIDKIKAAITSHTNPFTADGDSLYHLINHAYVPQEYVPQILNIDATGQKMYESYVAERIAGNISVWAPLKRANNKMYTSGNRTQTVKVRDASIDLKETKNLYGRLMVLAKSNRDVDMKGAIGEHEFTLTPRSLFSPNGAVLTCNDKSKLINALQQTAAAAPEPTESAQIPRSQTTLGDEVMDHDTSRKIAIFDAMVIVQRLEKRSAAIMTVKDLGDCFIKAIMQQAADFNEIIVVFDTYTKHSVKAAVRELRNKGQVPVRYQVKDDTKLTHITLKRFLSHYKTKADLTTYLAQKLSDYSTETEKVVIVSADGRTKCNNDISFEANNHEEADTLIIYHAVLSKRRNPSNSHLMVFSPDTDVLVLLVANYQLLHNVTCISMVSGVIDIKSIWSQLGERKAKALPGLHAFSGADNIGRFSRVGKLKWFKQYQSQNDEVLCAFQMLLDSDIISDHTFDMMAQFVCRVYQPKGINITQIPELRWHLFCKTMAESEKLPPTLGTLKQHVNRVHVQARIWGQATVAQQVQISPVGHGYYEDDNGCMRPHISDVSPAPTAIVEMVRCQCKTNCKTQRCSCKHNTLSCTDLCRCSSDCENDEDTHVENCILADDSDSD